MNDAVERMSGSWEMSEEVVVVSQAGDVLHLECQWREVDGSRWTVQVELTRLTDELDMENKGQRGSKATSRH